MTDQSFVDNIRLARHFVKWEAPRGKSGPVVVAVKVADVRRRRILAQWEFQQREPYMEPQPVDLGVYGERLKRNGSYAFVVGPTDNPGVPGWDPESRVYEVHRFDSTGTDRLEQGSAGRPEVLPGYPQHHQLDSGRRAPDR